MDEELETNECVNVDGCEYIEGGVLGLKGVGVEGERTGD